MWMKVFQVPGSAGRRSGGEQKEVRVRFQAGKLGNTCPGGEGGGQMVCKVPRETGRSNQRCYLPLLLPPRCSPHLRAAPWPGAEVQGEVVLQVPGQASVCHPQQEVTNQFANCRFPIAWTLIGSTALSLSFSPSSSPRLHPSRCPAPVMALGYGLPFLKVSIRTVLIQPSLNQYHPCLSPLSAPQQLDLPPPPPTPSSSFPVPPVAFPDKACFCI